MSDFDCPECGGGFPKDAVYGAMEERQSTFCPWCGKDLDVIAMMQLN